MGVSFVGAGTCTIDASQERTPQGGEVEPLPEAPEAQQSFAVSEETAAPTATKTPTKKHRASCPARRPKCATLIVHVDGYGGPKGGRGPHGSHVLERQPLRIVKLGVSGRALNSLKTSTHRVRVAAGTYEVMALVEGVGRTRGP